MTERLLIFARAPEPGRCKTRLIPALGEQGAAALHAALVERCLEWAARLPRAVRIDLLHDGAIDWFQSCATNVGAAIRCLPQVPGDLGARLRAGFQQAFDEGSERVVAVGTDCPELTERVVLDAFVRLGSRDAVIGPARDGGYYLIGLSRRMDELFDDIAWGTERVLAQTLHRIDASEARAELLEELGDVDVPADLELCRRVGIAVPC